MSAVALLADGFTRHADRPAVVNGGRSIDYGSLQRKVQGLRAHLRHQGLRPGDTVSVRLPNGPELLAFYLACLFGGLRVAPIGVKASRDETANIRSATQPKLDVESLDLSAIAESDEPLTIEGTAGGTFLVTFTSGTTGRPKGICHSAERLLANAAEFNRLAGLGTETRLLHVMPMSYMAGILNTILSPLIAGGAVVLAPQFEAARAADFWGAARAADANAVWLSPTMAALLARLNRSEEVPAWTRQTLRNVFVGTAPLLPTVRDSFERVFGVECLESYGMSEVLLVSGQTLAQLRTPGSVGPLLRNVEVATRKSQLFVRSPYLALGILDPERGYAFQALDPAQWFATGDIGHLEPDGQLRITGRLKDIIIKGGLNISPRAVEEVLLKCPGVRDAAVIGAPHPFWGEEVVAFIEPSDAAPAVAVLQRHCRESMNPDVVPGRFVTLPALPRNNNGKVLKGELRKLL